MILSGETIDSLCRLIASIVPIDSFRDPNQVWLHRAFLGMLLLGPLFSSVGVMIVHFRLAFFAEAIGHSAFTGLAIGLWVSAIPFVLFGSPMWVMTAFGIVVALAITYLRRRETMSTDTIIGVFSSFVVALGLALISLLVDMRKLPNGNTSLMAFLQGNILLIEPSDLERLGVILLLIIGFQVWAFNRMMLIGINEPLARTMGLSTHFDEYIFAGLLAAVVMVSIQAVGALLVSAMLVIPSAAARNLARSAGGLFWWGLLIASSSTTAGLIISDRFSTGTGATAVLCATAWFVVSSMVNAARMRS